MPAKPLHEMTLADHAEAWARERGIHVPGRDTKAFDKLYERWVSWAFEEFAEGIQQPIGESAMPRTLVAAYTDGYLAYAADVEEETGDPYLPRFWPWPYSEDTALPWELVELVNVPEDIARNLVFQGGMNQVYRDGYEAASAAAPYISMVVYIHEPEE